MKFKKTLVMRERKFKSTILSLLLMAPILLSAQDSAVVKIEKPRVHEVGLAFPNLSDLGQLGLIYRIGSEKALWRFGTFSFNGSDSDAQRDSTGSILGNGFNVNVTAGREYRKKISEKFELRYGADLSFGFRKSKNTRESTSYDPDSQELLYTRKSKDETTSYAPGLGLVLGFNYSLLNNLILGAEVKPSITYSYRENNRKTEMITDTESQTTQDLLTSNSLSYGFSNYSVLLSLAYRF